MKIHFDRIKPDDQVALAAKSCYGIENDRNIFHYFGWIPRIFELFSKIRQIRKSLCALKTPCIAYQALNDELVAKSSIKLLKQNPYISVGELTGSGHYYHDESDFKTCRVRSDSRDRRGACHRRARYASLCLRFLRARKGYVADRACGVGTLRRAGSIPSRGCRALP